MADELVMKLRLWGVIWPEDVDKPQGHLYEEAADRIEQLVAIKEELEAKLRKAVGALGDISNGEPEWPDDAQRELDWCRNRATTTLAELTGEE